MPANASLNVTTFRIALHPEHSIGPAGAPTED